MAHEIDQRMFPLLEQLESAFPMQDFGVTIVVMDQREGKNQEISVYGNRTGHGKYRLLEHALEQEELLGSAQLSLELDALNAKARGHIS